MTPLQVHRRTFRIYPCAWWFVWLAFIKGIPATLGIASQVSTPESSYAGWTLTVWGLQLIVAASVTALGLATCDPSIQRWGFILLAVAMTYDLAAIIYYYGLQRPAYTLLYVGFVAACLVRSLPRYRQGSTDARVRGNGR